MKKYRCPWCVSTGNHNILYFVRISGTCSLNTAICLWKASNSLARRGSGRSDLPQNRGKPQSNRRPSPIPVPPPSVAPCRDPAQDAGMVQLAGRTVRVVDNGDGSRPSLHRGIALRILAERPCIRAWLEPSHKPPTHFLENKVRGEAAHKPRSATTQISASGKGRSERKTKRPCIRA